VQDFATTVASISLEQQEQQIISQLTVLGLQNVSSTPAARKTCELEHAVASQPPATVLRYETADLSRLPDDVDQKVSAGKNYSAAVGACEIADSDTFTRYRVAILLF
jgi:hypothetical protein